MCFVMLPMRAVVFSVISVCVETGTPAVEIFTGALKCPPHTPFSLSFALALPIAFTNSKSDRRRRSVNGWSPVKPSSESLSVLLIKAALSKRGESNPSERDLFNLPSRKFSRHKSYIKKECCDCHVLLSWGFAVWPHLSKSEKVILTKKVHFKTSC